MEGVWKVKLGKDKYLDFSIGKCPQKHKIFGLDRLVHSNYTQERICFMVDVSVMLYNGTLLHLDG